MSISVGTATATAPVQIETAPRPLSEDDREVIQAVKAVNAAGLFGQDNEMTYILDRSSHRPALRIVNKTTHELVAQIPSETVLRLAAGLKGI